MHEAKNDRTARRNRQTYGHIQRFQYPLSIINKTSRLKSAKIQK